MRVWPCVVGVVALVTLLSVVLAGAAGADPPGSPAGPGLGGPLAGGAPVGASRLPSGLASRVGQALYASADPQGSSGSPSQQELLASDGVAGDQFGDSVSLADGGQVALVAAQARDGLKGAAYVFVRRGGVWTQQQELQAMDGLPLDNFGFSVSLSANGRVALIGAIGKDGGKGAAYVFVRHGGSWVQQQELQAADGATGDSFGFSVSLSDSGDVALVGAEAKDGQKGAAYVLVRHGDSWTQQQELQAADGAPPDGFGVSASLSASGRLALIGAWQKDGGKGTAYVFVREGGSYSQEQELQAADGAAGDRFGQSVSLSDSGHVALIGAGDKNAAKGTAYVFVREAGNYSQQQELQAADGAPADGFGFSVSLSASGRVALIGADAHASKGAAYVFVREAGSYSQRQELQAEDGAPGDGFGFRVSLSDSGRVALIGAVAKDVGKGAAYVFDGIE